MFKYTDSPYRQIPDDLKSEYTMNGTIPVFDWYFDGTKPTGVTWNDKLITKHMSMFTPDMIRANKEGDSPYGHDVCVSLLNSFEKYDIRNKRVAVVGSETPWIEAMLINMQNRVTTIEYNVPETNYANLECRDYFDYFENNNDVPFDAIVTFSSIEHSGLGRYGDPLDPDGDLKTMKCIHKNLKDDGLLIWGAPVGADALTWNAHRVYGPIRLPLLFANFKELHWGGGMLKHRLLTRTPKRNGFQPTVVLKKINGKV
jgi:hypothetical protein